MGDTNHCLEINASELKTAGTKWTFSLLILLDHLEKITMNIAFIKKMHYVCKNWTVPGDYCRQNFEYESVLTNFLLTDATDRSKISSDHHR